MIRLFHVSDIHFGAADKAALDWFRDRTRAEKPDAVIMTGDLTMRARRREFEAAGGWLRSLGRPVTVEVGNHDLPYFDPIERLLTPYRRYRAIEQMVERPLAIAGVTVVPLRTTSRFQLRLDWSKGSVSAGALETSLALIDAAPRGNVILVAAHHPLVGSGTRGGDQALDALARRGVAAVLTGHVHDPFDIAHDVEGRSVRLIGAGTLSERVRGSPPSFNEIRIAQGGIEVIARNQGADDERLTKSAALPS